GGKREPNERYAHCATATPRRASPNQARSTRPFRLLHGLPGGLAVPRTRSSVPRRGEVGAVTTLVPLRSVPDPAEPHPLAVDRYAPISITNSDMPYTG